MYNFDSLTLQYFFDENKDFIKNSVVQKIQLPSRHEIILNIRNIKEAKNKKLYININPKYPHICFASEDTLKKRDIEIPKQPPMFCMQLRKYLNGSKIKDFKIVKYERILEIYFDYFDEIGSLTELCLALEFMGKHSNIILYNSKSKTITGSIHNISQDKSSVREIYGGIKYIYPPLKQKENVLNTSYSTFYEIAKDKDIKEISNNFYYLNQALVEKIFENYSNIEESFNFIQKLVNGEQKEFLINFWNGKNSVNEALDNYFSNIMFDEILYNKKQKLKKILSNDIKKLEKILKNKPQDNKANLNKLKADYIMCNLYNLSQGQKEFIFEDIKIDLDENLTPQENAQKYYSQYKKEKTAFEYNISRYNRAKEKQEYFESIIFNIENAPDFETLNGIFEEISELNSATKPKEKHIQKIEKTEFKGFEIYIGKNNK